MFRKKIVDPYFEREARNYDNPIPSRECILSVIELRKRPISAEQLTKKLNISDKAQKEAIQHRLSAMVRDCQLLQRGEGYLAGEFIESVTGIVCFDVKGQVMVLPDDGGDLVYLYANEAKGLYDGDKIVVNINRYDHDGRAFGALVEVLEAIQPKILGKFVVDSEPPTVLPLDQKLPPITLTRGSRKAKEGNIVVVAIDRKQTTEDKSVGEIVEILGDPHQPGIFTDIALRRYEIPTEWPTTVLKQCEHIQETVIPQDIKGRVDLRNHALVTIDGEDAKDFDDAVYCEPQAGGKYRLFVAIADVSHYVRDGMPLDKEAIKRGNSVYFPDKVVPMLPEQLSNGLCSLKPKVDRLCVVCEMQIDAKGIVKDAKFYEAVMCSKARLTYMEVTALLGGNKTLRQKHEDLVAPLEDLEALYHILDKARQLRGAIAFETVETQVLFDEEGRIRSIVPRHRTIAHKIIEECMLAANVASATYLKKNNYPALYRIHEGPTNDKLTDLRAMLAEYGLQLKGGNSPTPQDYNAIVAKIQDLPNQDMLQMALLRSLSQAMYSPDNIGHFGLAYLGYLHFTSPIRRYPDLLVHRAIKVCLQGKKVAKSAKEAIRTELLELGEHCSHTERRADDATREVVQALKCQYLQSRIGEVFVGTVTHVASFGLFVALNEVFIEGLIHVRKLGREYFHFDNVKHRMTGDVSRKVYQIGDVFSVQLLAVEPLAGKIDLVLYDPENPEGSEDPHTNKNRKNGPRGAQKNNHTGKPKKKSSSHKSKSKKGKVDRS